MAEKRYNSEVCAALLCEMRKTLEERGEARYPRRSDFSDEEVVAIKAYLGPWPRALEKAGLKPPKDDDRARLNLEKRIRSKRRRREAQKQEKKESGKE